MKFKNLVRNRLFTGVAGMLCLGFALAPLLGCPQQQTIASLTSVLGTAAAQIAALQGNPELGNKITLDKEAAVTAITNWKQGSPSDYAIQGLNLLMDDLNLIPAASPYAALIDIAAVTAQAIILQLQPAATPAATATADVEAPQAQTRATMAKPKRTHTTGKPAPKNEKEFKAQWNAVVAQKALPPAAAIK